MYEYDHKPERVREWGHALTVVTRIDQQRWQR